MSTLMKASHCSFSWILVLLLSALPSRAQAESCVETISDAALCGADTITDGAACSFTTITDGAKCGWDTF